MFCSLLHSPYYSLLYSIWLSSIVTWWRHQACTLLYGLPAKQKRWRHLLKRWRHPKQTISSWYMAYVPANMLNVFRGSLIFMLEGYNYELWYIATWSKSVPCLTALNSSVCRIYSRANFHSTDNLLLHQWISSNGLVLKEIFVTLPILFSFFPQSPFQNGSKLLKAI